jgi:hypothetical protein
LANNSNRPELASEAGNTPENPRSFGMAVMREILGSYAEQKMIEWGDRNEAARGVTTANVQRLALAFNSPEMSAYDK